MKRKRAFSLAPAADAEIEEVALRPGHTVTVETAEEFAVVYNEVYEKNSDVNCIRLTDSISAFGAAFRNAIKDGNTPFMPGYEGTLLIRMPEGTCLDLNGCMLSMRANQGLDGGAKSLGKIVDTFGGGWISLQVINEVDYIPHAIDLAQMYPEFVRRIVISKPMKFVKDASYVIPYNVCLRFSGKDAWLPAKSVTLKSGATIESADPANCKMFTGGGEVVFECASEADKTREGISYATKTVDVTDAAPPIPVKKYVIPASVSDVVSETATPAAVTQPPVIDSAASSTTEAAVIQTPSAAPYTLPTEFTREQLQQALVETALAYYYHNPYVQYDGRSVCVSFMERDHDDGAPEDAAMDSQVYSVCSDFCHKTYFQALDFKIYDDTTRTRTWCCYPTGTPGVVYQYVGPDTPAGVAGEKDLQKALTESRKVLQPGDIIVAANKDTGHAMLFIGDAFGDGKEYLVHCWGKSWNTKTGEDPKEGLGSIRLQTVEECCYADGAGPNWYLGKASNSDLGFAVLRPLDDPACPKTVNAKTASRLRFPRMTITRELDRTKYDSAQTGEKIPVYITITNNSKQEYKELPVEEHLPNNATLVEGSATNGAKIDGKTIRWAVKIPAGKTITLTYKLRIDAGRSETVRLAAGKVAEIPTRATSLTVGGKPLTAEQRSAVASYAQSVAGRKTAYRDLQSFNDFYGKALGVDIGLPATTAELLQKLVTTRLDDGNAMAFRRTPAAEDAALAQMIVPLHFTGRYVSEGGIWGRVREYRGRIYTPGDLFVCLGGKSTTSVESDCDVGLYVYLGDSKVLHYAQSGAQIEQFSANLGRALRCNLLLCLRPTLGYDDLAARVCHDR